MNCPTSSNQKKRQQKTLQSQGKLLPEPPISHMLSPIHNHMEESLAFPKNLNRMAPQEPTRIPIQNSLPPKQRQSDEQPNQQSDLSPQTNSSTKWHPTATQELLRILSQNSQPQQKSPPKEIPNPQINSFSTNTTLQINLVFANTNSKPTTNSPSNTIQIKQINSSMTNKKSPLDIFYPIPMQSPTWPSLQEANNMSTHQHKKPKICKSDQLIPSHATNNHLQTIPTSTSQQNRSQKEIGKTCNEQSNKHRNRIPAISAPQTDCPQTSPQLNRKSNPEQGKPPHNITNPTTPASSINNQKEEHTVPPSPPPHSINRHKGHRNKPALPAPQADCPLPHPHPNRHNNPAQGKYTQNNTELTTPASSINNQIEEYPVFPSPPHPTTEQARPIVSEPSPEEPHPQPNQTPTSPQHRSPPETAKDRKKKRKEYRNQPALPALQADNSLPRPHITRNNDQATLLNAANATPNTSHHQAQGNPLPNNTQLSMSASPINNQIEEYTVPPSPQTQATTKPALLPTTEVTLTPPVEAHLLAPCNNAMTVQPTDHNEPRPHKAQHNEQTIRTNTESANYASTDTIMATTQDTTNYSNDITMDDHQTPTICIPPHTRTTHPQAATWHQPEVGNNTQTHPDPDKSCQHQGKYPVPPPADIPPPH